MALINKLPAIPTQIYITLADHYLQTGQTPSAFRILEQLTDPKEHLKHTIALTAKCPTDYITTNKTSIQTLIDKIKKHPQLHKNPLVSLQCLSIALTLNSPTTPWINKAKKQLKNTPITPEIKTLLPRISATLITRNNTQDAIALVKPLTDKSYHIKTLILAEQHAATKPTPLTSALPH